MVTGGGCCGLWLSLICSERMQARMEKKSGLMERWCVVDGSDGDV